MRSILRLKPYLSPYRWLIVTTLLLALPLAALRLGPVPVVKYVMDDLFVSRDPDKLLLVPAFVIALYSVNFVVRFFHYYFMRIVVCRVNQRIKSDLFNHVQGLSADYFTNKGTGNLISRVGHDPNLVDAGIASFSALVREPLHFLGLLGYCVYTDWKLTIITVLMFPALAWVFSKTGKHMKRYMSRMAQENENLTRRLQETFSGIRVVKMFRLEDYTREKFSEANDNFTKFHLKVAILEEAAHPMVELVTAFAIAAVAYYGGAAVIANSMTPGDLIAFFTAFALMINPLRTLNDINIKIHHASAAVDRIFEVLDWKPNMDEANGQAELPRSFESLEFKDVNFSYPDATDRQVLKSVNFKVSRGEVVAFVGASGAGKSSIVTLVPRIFDVTGGQILLNGKDIRSFPIDPYREFISVVSQDVFLFNDTIAENIRCGRLNATDEELIDAAKKANAWEYIEHLPDGMQTLIGERGQKLSGGERQRLSIARAFLRYAPLLVLDEATSSLDSASERAVQQALDELMKDRTTLVVAHRLSTIRHADRILVVKEGQIVESGTHDTLIDCGKEYARFYKIAESMQSEGLIT